MTGDLDWPDGYGRTPDDERQSYDGTLTIDYRDAFDSVFEEIRRWGGIDIRIKSVGPHYADDPHIPEYSTDPEDPGVVAYYHREEVDDDARYAIACDRYETQYENARAVALYARRKRLAEKCGVTTAEAEHENTRLGLAKRD